MTLRKIIDLGFINPDTEIWVRNPDMRVIYHGDFERDVIQEFFDFALKSFTWQDDDNFYIDLAGNGSTYIDFKEG